MASWYCCSEIKANQSKNYEIMIDLQVELFAVNFEVAKRVNSEIDRRCRLSFVHLRHLGNDLCLAICEI